MKPNEARRLRKRAEAEKAARGERLQAYLETGTNPMHVVVPELIPTADDRDKIEREIRKVARRAEAQPRGPRRDRKVDELIPLVHSLVFVEKVLALDPLERAGLRVAQLETMSRVRPDEMMFKLREIVAGIVGGGDAPRIEVARRGVRKDGEDA